MAEIIDGRGLAEQIKNSIAAGVQQLKETKSIIPGLATVLVGQDPASQVYIRNKNKSCEAVGMVSRHLLLDGTISEQELLGSIEALNRDTAIHGILVQLPLPGHIDEDRVICAIDPCKDVDGFHPINMGKLLIGQPGFKPCTPFGIMKMLEKIHYPLKGKSAVVVGRSNIVGKPVALLLLAEHATVTICHSRTENIGEIVRSADVVIAAVGRARFIQGDWIKPGAVVIDVGINRDRDGKLVGDVDYDACAPRAAYITPVPGGVGPMTIAMLLANTLIAAGGELTP